MKSSIIACSIGLNLSSGAGLGVTKAGDVSTTAGSSNRLATMKRARYDRPKTLQIFLKVCSRVTGQNNNGFGQRSSLGRQPLGLLALARSFS
jgi:hypothetical protein